jgi:tetratricopeptide (TPR) repeat protein
LEQLAARGETDAIHRRHAEYFLRLNHQAAEQLRGPRYRHWLQRGDAEVENVRLALAWAVAQDPELAIRLGREAGWYFLTRGAMLEARQWLERALAAAEQIPDDLRAGALVDIGMQATTCGDFAAAESVIQESLAVYRQLGDEVGEATCLFNLARVAGWQGNNTEAVSFATQALGPLRRADDSLLTMALANLGLNLRRTGALEQAAAILEEGLAQGERRGDIWACVVILKEQGWLELERGDLRRARQALRRAMLLNRDLADPRYLSQVLDVCAWLAVAEGAAERAARLLGAAMRLRAIIGVPFVVRYQRDYDHYVPAARAQIGDAAWEAAWAEGHALSQEDAIELALQGLA